MIRGILFDKDGTLLDFNGTWLAPYLEATSYLANSVGKPELANELMVRGGYIPETSEWCSESALASGTNSQIMALWSDVIGMPISAQDEREMRKIFSHAGTRYVPAVEDIRELFVELGTSGIKLGLATMDDESNAHSMLSRLELNGVFDFVCGADSGYGVKPEAGMIHEFCRRCQLGAEEIIMVGDSPMDLSMGSNAGVACCVGVLTGAHGFDDLEKWGDVVLQDISGLPELVASLNSGN